MLLIKSGGLVLLHIHPLWLPYRMVKSPGGRRLCVFDMLQSYQRHYWPSVLLWWHHSLLKHGAAMRSKQLIMALMRFILMVPRAQPRISWFMP